MSEQRTDLDGDVAVEHQPSRSTYVVTVGGEQVGRADYRRNGDTVVFTHTFVDPPMRGHGLAERLVEFAVADVREQGLRPVGQCWYVAAYLDDHPEGTPEHDLGR
jgi:predicted GNAT family acetyltransferase